jgi:hypothetical protein
VTVDWGRVLVGGAVAVGLLLGVGIFWAVLRQGIALERLVEVLRVERGARPPRRQIGFGLQRPEQPAAPPPSGEGVRPWA